MKKAGARDYLYMCHGQVCSGTTASRAKNGLDTEDICRVPAIPSWKLQMMVCEIFHMCLQDVDTILGLVEGMLEKHINDKAERKITPARETEIREEIDTLEKRLDRCTELFLDHEISERIYKKKKTEYEIRISDLQEELDELCGDAEEDDETLSVTDRVSILVNGLRTEILDHDFREAYMPERIIDAFIDHIVVHEDSVDWYLRCTGNDEWDSLIYSEPDEEKRKERPCKTYYGYIPGYGKEKHESYDEIFEEVREKAPKAAKTTEIMSFVLTREDADAFRAKIGKPPRKIKWNDITVRVFV